MASGNILDSIQVNGQHFGAPPHRGPDKKRINLAQGEKVTSIQYQVGFNGFSYCNLKIHTNVDSYGPYAIKRNYRHCDMNSPVITRNISNGDFLAFMRQHSQLNKDGQIELNWSPSGIIFVVWQSHLRMSVNKNSALDACTRHFLSERSNLRILSKLRKYVRKSVFRISMWNDCEIKELYSLCRLWR